MKITQNVVMSGGIVLALTLFLLPAPAPGAQIAAFLLLFVWPVVTWLGFIRGPLPERAVATAALVLLLNVLIVLLFSYLPGPVSRWGQLLLHLLLVVGPLIWRRSWPALPRINLTARHGLLLLFLFATLLLRLPNLGYSEFQGDEGVVLMRAAAMITGDDSEIFLHQKGPVEILLPLSLWNLAGTLNEFWARLPFAWAGTLAVFGVMALARRWSDGAAAWLAAGLFAVSGFAVAFSRIVQYQSLVMLWSTLAVLFAARYREEGAGRDLTLTAVFLAGGLLAHYDAVLVVPAVAWLVWPRFWPHRDVRHWWGATLTGAFILLTFYLPFLLNPNFARTGQYLLGARLGVDETGGFFGWSGTAVWQMVTLYNSLYFVLGIVFLVMVGIATGRHRRGGGAALLFFGVPLLFYLFIVSDPRTHVYTFFPGAALWGAWGGAWIGERIGKRHRVLRAARAVLLLFFGVAAVYIYLIFIDNTPERQRTWSENAPRFYPTTWEAPPLYGLFGFPHQAGWRVAADLVREYPYASNEEQEVADWYMAQAPRTHCADFEQFVLTYQTQDAVPYDAARLDGLFLRHEVLVNGRLAMQIFGYPPPAAPTRSEAVGQRRWLRPQQVTPPSTGGAIPVDAVLGDGQVRLVGYDLPAETAVAGGELAVTLYWQALAPFSQNYQVFTHLYDGVLRAQHDGGPECGMNPTVHWEPGEMIPDPHPIAIPPQTPPGQYPLLVGMYALVGGERLPTGDPHDAIHLTTITIEEAAP